MSIEGNPTPDQARFEHWGNASDDYQIVIAEELERQIEAGEITEEDAILQAINLGLGVEEIEVGLEELDD